MSLSWRLELQGDQLLFNCPQAAILVRFHRVGEPLKFSDTVFSAIHTHVLS